MRPPSLDGVFIKPNISHFKLKEKSASEFLVNVS
jgi:hypothetical protein